MANFAAVNQNILRRSDYRHLLLDEVAADELAADAVEHTVNVTAAARRQEARENIRPNSLAAEFLNAYLDEVGNKPMEM